MSDPANSPHGEGGFATLEALVAFLVLSLGLAVAVQAVFLATRSHGRATEAAREVQMVKHALVGLPEKMVASGPQRGFVALREVGGAIDTDQGVSALQVVSPGTSVPIRTYLFPQQTMRSRDGG